LWRDSKDIGLENHIYKTEKTAKYPGLTPVIGLELVVVFYIDLKHPICLQDGDGAYWI